MKTLIQKLEQNENLSTEEVQMIMQTIMSGQADESDIADFLLALRKKGPTVEEITGAAKIMHEFVVPIDSKYENVLDTKHFLFLKSLQNFVKFQRISINYFAKHFYFSKTDKLKT